MAEVGRTFVTVVPSARGFGKSLDGQVGKDVDATGKRTGSRFGAAIGSAAKVGLAVGGVALIGFAKKTIGAASLAQQSLGATETVFGRFSKTVVRTSNEAATNYGLSANTYRENANLIGSLFKNQGVSTDQLAGKTEKMIGVGADLAATFGGTTTEAVETLGAAFKGEYDSIERYGISLKESEVSAELARRGQDKLTGSAGKLAKQQVVTDMIMRQSKDSLGAFGRESNTLAGQQQRLGAAWENLMAKLGAKLIPIATKVVAFFAKFITQMQTGEGAGGRFADIMSAVGDVLGKVGGFIRDVVVPFLGKLKDKFTEAQGGTSGFKQTMRDLEPVVRLVKAVLAALFKAVLFALPILVKWWGVLAKGLGIVARAAIWLWNKAFAPALRFITKGLGLLMTVWAKMLRALSKIPGFGWAKRAADAMQNAANKANSLGGSIKNIPPKKEPKVTATVTGKNAVDAAFNAISRVNSKKVYLDIEVRGSRAGKAAFNVGNGLLPRASGGPVQRGRTYIVGEAGPEIFTTRQRGQIIPNHEVSTSGAGGNTFNIYDRSGDPSRTAHETARRLAFAG